MGARGRTGAVAALGIVVALAFGCRSRPLVTGGGGTVTPDAGSTGAGGAGPASDGGPDRGRVPPPFPNGADCTSPGDCASGFCVRKITSATERICCDTACESSCSSCQLFGSAGTCRPVPAGQPPPASLACTLFTSKACLFDGTCDGAGACSIVPAGSPCGPGSCDGNTVEYMACDGKGDCLPTSRQDCAPYACDPATARCRDHCVADADCAGTPCQAGGRCGLNPEQSCQTSAECASGFCVSGFCCDSACDNPCMACNVTGREGSCSVRPGACPGGDAGVD